MRKKIFWNGFILGISSCLLFFVIMEVVLINTGVLDLSRAFRTNRGKHAQMEERIEKKADVLKAYIEEYYLNDINEKKMEDSIYKGIFNGLGDDYAAYYSSDEYSSIKEKTSGVFCGIGIYITVDQKTGMLKIMYPIDGSPAMKAGIKAEDIIYQINGKKILNKDISQIQSLTKGKPGSSVELTLIRGKKKITKVVKREKIKDKTVMYKMLDQKIGYIQVKTFEEVTPKQYIDAVNTLEKEGEKALIIDLRDNGGGLLDASVKMLDRMLPKGVVVYSKDNKGNKQNYYAKNNTCFDKPIAIIGNGGTASASEVFSGALLESKKAELIGTKTFGKGIVQGIYQLNDGSAMKMTVAKYYTPKGKNIHGVGFQPDIKVELSKKKEKLPVSGEKVDNQMKAAFDYLYERIA